MKEMKEDLKKIKEAISFLIPPEIGDRNYIQEKPKNILVPLLEKLEQQAIEREKESKRKIQELEEKMDNENLRKQSQYEEKLNQLKEELGDKIANLEEKNGQLEQKITEMK